MSTDGSVRIKRSKPLLCRSDATSTLSEQSNMHALRDHRIQRWIDGHDAPCGSNPLLYTIAPEADAMEEERTRQKQDNVSGLDWELEQFEREIASRFVSRDLELRLEDGESRASTPMLAHHTRPHLQWTRSPSSTSTLRALTPIASPLPPPTPTPPPRPDTPLTTVSPTPPSTPPSICDVPSISDAPSTPDTSSRPTSFLSAFLRPPHKYSPSMLSLPSHFSTYSSSSDVRASISARSFTSKLKHNPLVPPITPPPHPPVSSPRSPISSPRSPTSTSAGRALGAAKQRVSSLGPKKRRLIIRGIDMDDERSFEGIRHWAGGLGELSRIWRAQDGAIWVEFRDKRVAENVCCLQAQVQIPRVGRVILDWAEGRPPG